MLLLVLCFVPRVLSEVSQQHHVYVSRKSRENAEPYSSGYVYKQVNNNPGTFSTFGTGMEKKDIDGSRPTVDSHPIGLSAQINLTPDISLLTKDSVAKYDAGFLASKIKTDYDRIKSSMGYRPSVPGMFRYDTEHLRDDAGTGSKGRHDISSSPLWPYYSYNPYESEHMRIDSEIEKAKDKRYTADAAKIIPIHEDLSDDIPNSREPLVTTGYYFPSTDNPIGRFSSHSSTLGDYFNTNFKDQLAFKDLGNGKYFDIETSRGMNDNFSKFRHPPM